MRVAILGASNRPSRYSHQALVLLREKGHEVFPVNPLLKEIENVTVYPTLRDLPELPETLTMYVGPERSSALREDILACGARRVIFNPGSENADLEKALREKGIEALEACTLVLLRTGQF